ncbi:histidine phosphatase family protein [Jiella sonneratiae]|nr:histidine phosphatase family protein [Jiella sonneratiae]
MAAPAAARDAWDAARAGGTHLLMRHAVAPGTGDPADVTLGDCSTQRNLSEAGRQQAERIGRKLVENGVAIDVVLTSQWCRARDTAERLGFRPVKDEPALNSFFAGRGDRAEQTEALKQRIAEFDAAGRKAAMVSHQVNITALTGVYPASGEIVVIRLGKDGGISVEGQIRTD